MSRFPSLPDCPTLDDVFRHFREEGAASLLEYHDIVLRARHEGLKAHPDACGTFGRRLGLGGEAS